jgi:hypothetical protein
MPVSTPIQKVVRKAKGSDGKPSVLALFFRNDCSDAKGISSRIAVGFSSYSATALMIITAPIDMPDKKIWRSPWPYT